MKQKIDKLLDKIFLRYNSKWRSENDRYYMLFMMTILFISMAIPIIVIIKNI